MIIRRSFLTSLDFGGLKILDYTRGRDSLSSIAQVSVPCGAMHPEAYSKRSDKYYIVLSGAVRFILDEKEHDLTAGDCCIIVKGHHFSYRNTSDEDVTLLLIHTPPFSLDDEVFVQ